MSLFRTIHKAPVLRALLITGLLFAVVTAVISLWGGLSVPGLVVAGCGYGFVAILVHRGLDGTPGLGAANRVTLVRALGVLLLAATLTDPSTVRAGQWVWISVGLAVLILDGVDGWLARHLGISSDFGARFDMEVDAALILVLCLGVWVTGRAGSWVLLLGLMRYAFVAAGGVWPWMGRPLPTSLRRKTICVWQIASLVVVMVPITPSWLAVWILMPALVLLAYSFTVDLAWLYRAGGHHENSEAH